MALLRLAVRFQRRSLFVFVSIALAMGSSRLALAQQLDPAQDLMILRTMRLIDAAKVDPSDAASILVERGCPDPNPSQCPESAKEYYANTIDVRLVGLKSQTSTLDSFVSYFGYAGIRAVDLETLDSDTLMPRDQASLDKLRGRVASPAEFAANPNLTLSAFKSGALLSARFFAPKIVDYNAAAADPKTGFDPHTPGWRKLVRLNALPSSDAYRKGGAKAAYILFNFFEARPDINPFPVRVSNGKLVNEAGSPQQSVNNQVIVVPRTFKAGEDNSILFLDYQPFSTGYAVGDSLNAAFDTLDPNSSKQLYYLPVACAACHGHDYERGAPLTQKSGQKTFPFGKINYLDTDQWYDMLKFDFPKTSAGNNDVVFDGGKDHSTQRYKDAVGVIHTLNTEIKAQNIGSRRPKGQIVNGEAATDDFKVQAVTKWLQLHAHGEGPATPDKRSIGVSSWSHADLPLLELLDHYCFRCHSSMFYDVFDRAAVVAKKNQIKAFVSACSPSGSCYMPQGRKIEQSDRDNLIKYISSLK